MNKQDLLALDAEHLSPALNRAFDIVVEKAEGSYIFDISGDKYLDMTSGIAVNQLGHSHPEVVKAISEQAAKCIHTSCVVHYPANILLAEKLSKLLPGDISSVFFCNSGAESVDGAIKLAKILKPERNNYIVHRGSFHGRTLAATALTTSKAAYTRHYQPLLTGIHVVEYPNVYAMGDASKRDWLTDHCIDIFEKQLATEVDPESIGAIFIEPVLGEGGYIPAPGIDGQKNYLKYLREFCDKHGILLVFDEVQCGVARTGKWFASEYYGVVPDVVLMAKGMTGGIPLGAFATTKELMYKMPPGSHGSTFGGNPVACMAALKNLEILERDNIMDNVAARSKQIFDFFEAKFPGSNMHNKDTAKEDRNTKIQVRGLGLMIALQFEDAEAAKKVVHYGYDKKVLLLGCGTYGNNIRLAPDLTISEADLQIALDTIAEAINNL